MQSLLVACLATSGDRYGQRIAEIAAGYPGKFRVSRATYQQEAEDLPALLELLKHRSEQPPGQS